MPAYPLCALLNLISYRSMTTEPGGSQYEIMAIPGHSEAKTSEVDTRRVEHWKLALGGNEESRCAPSMGLR